MRWKVTVQGQNKYSEESQSYINGDLIRILKLVKNIEGKTYQNKEKENGWNIYGFYKTFKTFDDAINFMEKISSDLFFIKLERYY